MIDLENTQKILELYRELKAENIQVSKNNPIIIDESLATLYGVYGLDGVVTIEWEGQTYE